jgi:hypothetical protein
VCDVERNIEVVPIDRERLRIRFSSDMLELSEGGVSAQSAKNVRSDLPSKSGECFLTQIGVRSVDNAFKVESRSLTVKLDPALLHKDGQDLTINGIAIEDSDYAYAFTLQNPQFLERETFIAKFGADCGIRYFESGVRSQTKLTGPTFVASIADYCAVGHAPGVDLISAEEKYNLIQGARFWNYGVRQHGYEGSELNKFKNAMETYFNRINSLPVKEMTVDLIVNCPSCFSSLNGDIAFDILLYKRYADGDFRNTQIYVPTAAGFRPTIRLAESTNLVGNRSFDIQDRFPVYFAKRDGFYGKDFFLLLSSVLAGFGLALFAEIIVFLAKPVDNIDPPVSRRKKHRRRTFNSAPRGASYRVTKRLRPPK